MNYETILMEKQGHTTVVTFNRPDRMNPLSAAFFIEFKDILAGLRGDSACRFVIFTAAGKTFSCGFDMSTEAMEDRYKRPGLGNERQWQFFFHDIMNTMENLEKITIGTGSLLAVASACCLTAISGLPVNVLPSKYQRPGWACPSPGAPLPAPWPSSVPPGPRNLL
jgi:enoyl-CoA hydratase/carnithine racemase